MGETTIRDSLQIGLKLDPSLRLHALVKGMLDIAHIGHEIRMLDQRRHGVAPRDHQVQLGRLVLGQPRQHLKGCSSVCSIWVPSC